MRNKIILPLLILSSLTIAFSAHAQDEPIDGDIDIPVESYYKGQITEITSERKGPNETQTLQTLKVKILDGDLKDQEVMVENVGAVELNGGQKFQVGDKVVINKTSANGETVYYLQDNYRMPALMLVFALFLAIAIFFGRLKGLTSILGLVISILVISQFIVPRILAGSNPVLIVLIGSFAIVLASLYLAHGFSRRTSIALLGTIIVLLLSVGFSFFFVKATNLFGSGSEEALFLQIGEGGFLNLQGLLLGGIILGALGVLDDITTGQSAAVDEIHKANPALTRRELYKRGLSVGHEHIASLINTLALAYAGASLPLFVLFSMNQAAPVWTLINSEFVAEEIVRTLVGSTALILAVPITTYLAAYFISKQPVDPNASGTEPGYFGH